MAELFIVPEIFFPKDSGGKVATYQYFRRLHGPGTHLVGFYDPHRVDPEEVADRCRREFDLKDVHLIPFHIRIRRNPSMLLRTMVFMTLKGWPYLAAKFYSPEMIRTVKRIAAGEDVDRVILDRTNLMYLAPLIRRLCPGARILQISHNNEAEIALDYSRDRSRSLPVRAMARLESRLITAYQKKLIPFIHDFYCISAVDAEALNGTLGTNLFCYYPMPYYFDRPYDFHSPERFAAGICGSLAWPPNIEGLLWYLDTIHPVIMRELPDYRFLIAGSHASPPLEKKFRETPGVEYLGYVDDLKDFYDRCSLVIVPLLSGSGIRIKILDSFSYSKPVVATTKAVQGLQVDDGRELLFGESDEAFIACILRLARDSGLQRRLARGGYDYLTRVHGSNPFGS